MPVSVSVENGAKLRRMRLVPFGSVKRIDRPSFLYHRLEKSLDRCINWVSAEALIWMEAWFATLLFSRLRQTF